jgi:hypothetical protein
MAEGGTTSDSATGTAMDWWFLMFSLMVDDSFFLVNETYELISEFVSSDCCL